MNPTRQVRKLAYWINEREAIRKKKEAGLPRPWTKDPVLREFRFCNVHREDDAVTRWLKVNWRDPHATDPLLWHAMIVARFINWPDTLDECGWPEPWDKRRKVFVARWRARQARGDKWLTGAYKVLLPGWAGNKVDSFAGLFERAAAIPNPPRAGDTLAAAHAKLTRLGGIGPFLGAQVVADLKHTPVLKRAKDWWDWAAPGPGSVKGLAFVRGGRERVYLQQSYFASELLALRDELAPLIKPVRLCLQDLQNCLCEIAKYERGNSRSRYPVDA